MDFCSVIFLYTQNLMSTARWQLLTLEWHMIYDIYGAIFITIQFHRQINKLQFLKLHFVDFLPWIWQRNVSFDLGRTSVPSICPSMTRVHKITTNIIHFQVPSCWIWRMILYKWTNFQYFTTFIYTCQNPSWSIYNQL